MWRAVCRCRAGVVSRFPQKRMKTLEADDSRERSKKCSRTSVACVRVPTAPRHLPHRCETTRSSSIVQQSARTLAVRIQIRVCTENLQKNRVCALYLHMYVDRHASASGSVRTDAQRHPHVSPLNRRTIEHANAESFISFPAATYSYALLTGHTSVSVHLSSSRSRSRSRSLNLS